MIELKATDSLTQRTGQGRLVKPEGPPANSRTCGVLVVDDQAAMGGLLDLVLRQEGFTVWLAVNGWEAIDLYRRYHKTYRRGPAGRAHARIGRPPDAGCTPGDEPADSLLFHERGHRPL
jgi:hypothetical protein